MVEVEYRHRIQEPCACKTEWWNAERFKNNYTTQVFHKNMLAERMISSSSVFPSISLVLNCSDDHLWCDVSAYVQTFWISVCLAVPLCLLLSVCLLFHLIICFLSVFLTVFLSVFLSVCLSFCLSICLSACVCLPVYLLFICCVPSVCYAWGLHAWELYTSL